MACAVPSVVTSVGASAEILGDPARVTPPSDPGALAQALNRLIMMTPEERRAIGEADRERVRQRYNIADVADAYVALWRDVLGRT